MNFFERQDRARRHTGLLVVLFALAVLAVVASVTGVAAVAAASLTARKSALVVPTASWALRNADLLALVAGLTAVAILLASVVRSVELGSGGREVARSLGGRAVPRDTKRPEARRLLNVVEEMAIASGVPVPEVYLLDEEERINAFAAGLTPANAVIGVSRGAVEDLSRDELQGVIAHEFSHILNGDMRLNQRLAGILFGILFLAILGEGVLRSLRFARVSRGKNNQGGQLVLIALVAGVSLMVIGWLGVLFGRLIKAAVSRQRELLADASAVQFTRNPGGLGGALKTIAAGSGSYLEAPRADEFSHLLFARGRSSLRGPWATHPPLEERIRAIDPGFRPEELEEVARRVRARRAERAEERGERSAPARDSGRGKKILPGDIIDVAGTLDPERLVFAAALLSSLEKNVRTAAASPDDAPHVILALLLAREEDVRAAQLDAVREASGDEAAGAVRAWGERLAGTEAGARLPVLELALPALKERTAADLERLIETADRLIRADDRVEPFELALARTVAAYRDDLANPGASPHGRKTVLTAKRSVEVLLAAVAKNEAAYARGTACLPGMAWPAGRPEDPGVEALDRALDELAELTVREKEKLIAALGAIISEDGQVTVEEAELLRAVCAALRVPIPPLTV